MTVKEGERKSPVPWSEYSTHNMPLPILPPDRSNAVITREGVSYINIFQRGNP